MPRPRGAGLPPRRLRLHDLHRQLRPAAGGDLGGGRGGRPRRGLGALRQPQLRGPHQPRREDELPGLAAAGGGLRAGRDDGRRPRQRPARRGPGRRAGLPARHLALRGGGRARRSRRRCSRTCSAPATPRSSTATSAGHSLEVPEGDRFAWDDRLDLRAQAAVLRGPAARSPSRSTTSRARACWPSSATASPPTTSRPAGAIKKDSPAGAYLIEHGVERARLQLLRLAPRQPRGDDARHVREHPPAQPARAGHRGRRDPPPARRARR